MPGTLAALEDDEIRYKCLRLKRLRVTHLGSISCTYLRNLLVQLDLFVSY